VVRLVLLTTDLVNCSKKIVIRHPMIYNSAMSVTVGLKLGSDTHDTTVGQYVNHAVIFTITVGS
jgi:hypothetical protein